MPLSVADTSGNWNETIEHGAKTLGKSVVRRKVFRAIYTGKKNPKTVRQLASVTRLNGKQILTEGKKLADEGIVHQTRLDGATAYEKIRFYQKNRDRILTYAANPDRLAKLPTKRRIVSSSARTIKVRVANRLIEAKRITVDDIPALSKARKVPHDAKTERVSEATFKKGMAKLFKEQGRFHDWGGERNDLPTSRFMLEGKRREAAFAFKGPGTRGVLTPGKMGKNGDQIQRLVLSPAEVFIIQYHGQVAESVREQLAQLSQLKSVFEGKRIWYGVIDGQDSRRIIAAYPEVFS